ncbi:hypothetical protein BC936DRAFT_141529 [Jimgerdemannia flammicorona]|uniref:Uncharacterized protein n=1 Tax=Jimgerdemannia flammicorona TaxID=994334 RepID=A0A433DG69_9FUNG|nr:hypothetical protein BC936DRAFT_141529 [Jimgerdemannia flammicorona]
MHRISKRITQNLNLDMPCINNRLLQKHLLAGGLRQTPGQRGPNHLPRLANNANPPTTSPITRLDHDRVPDLQAERLDIHRRGDGRKRILDCAGDSGNTKPAGELARPNLVAHFGNRGGRRTDKDDARGVACGGEIGGLGEEAVARVDGCCLGSVNAWGSIYGCVIFGLYVGRR